MHEGPDEDDTDDDTDDTDDEIEIEIELDDELGDEAVLPEAVHPQDMQDEHHPAGAGAGDASGRPGRPAPHRAPREDRPRRGGRK